MNSFLDMIYLITIKISFFYKPAVINREIKICPKDFWHGYTKLEDWVLADHIVDLFEKTSF